jgi:hypothetical protein
VLCYGISGAKPEQEVAAGGTPGPSQAAAAADDGGGDVDMLDLTQVRYACRRYWHKGSGRETLRAAS